MFYPFIYNSKTFELSVGNIGDTIDADCISILPMKNKTLQGRWRWGYDTAKENISSLFAKYMPSKKQWSVFEKDILDKDRSIKPTSVSDFG